VDITEILAELRLEHAQLGEAILSLERVAAGGGKRRGDRRRGWQRQGSKEIRPRSESAAGPGQREQKVRIAPGVYERDSLEAKLIDQPLYGKALHECWACHAVGLKPGALETHLGDYGLRDVLRAQYPVLGLSIEVCVRCALVRHPRLSTVIRAPDQLDKPFGNYKDVCDDDSRRPRPMRVNPDYGP